MPPERLEAIKKYYVGKMIESLFYFFIILIVAIFVYGLYSKSHSFVLLSGVLSLVLGMVLMSGEGITIDQSKNFIVQDINASAMSIDVVQTTLTSSTDTLVFIFQSLFFYGGFLIIILALIMLYFSTRRTRNV